MRSFEFLPVDSNIYITEEADLQLACRGPESRRQGSFVEHQGDAIVDGIPQN